jgi:hypothetical protein
MAVEALDLPAGAPVETGEFERILSECFNTIETPVSRDRLRRLLSRGFLDDEATFTGSVRLLVDKLFKNSKGLMGALDRIEKKSGVDARKGLDDSMRTDVVMAAGYSAGAEFGPDGNIPFAFWKRAQRTHRRLVRRALLRNYRIAPAEAATIKDWCLRAGPQAENFKKARAAGFAERDNPDPSRGVDHRDTADKD